MKRRREPDVARVPFPWSDLIEDMQQIIFLLLDTFTQQKLALTCRAHAKRWYDPAAKTGRWMGKHLPMWNGYMDHSLHKTEGILQGIVEARRFDILHGLVESNSNLFGVYQMPIAQPYQHSIIAKAASGANWQDQEAYRIIYIEAADSRYSAAELRHLIDELHGVGCAFLYDILMRFYLRGQLELLSLLGACVSWENPILPMVLLLAEEPIDWKWFFSQYKLPRTASAYLWMAILQVMDTTECTGRSMGNMISALSWIPDDIPEKKLCAASLRVLQTNPRFNVSTE
jgi:hypothetical protein